jgi:peptidyl-prolyl cis-trans isomerase C
MFSSFARLSLSLALGLMFFLPDVLGAATPAAPPADIAAKVNGETISYEQLDNEFQARTRVPFAMVKDNPQAQQIRKQVLEQLVDGILLIQEAEKQQLTVTSETVEERFKTIQDRFPSPEVFNQALSTRGLTADALKQDIRKGALRQEIIHKEVISKVSVTAEEMKTFFQTHPDKYKQEEEVHARHILIKVDANAFQEDDQKAKDQASTILAKAKKGEDFAGLAKQYSEDTSKEQGGDLGYFGRGQMVPEFEEAAFGLKVGEISDLVRTQFGYHIIKVEEKKESKALSYEEAEGQVKDDLTREKAIARYQEYVGGLRQKASITIYLN